MPASGSSPHTSVIASLSSLASCQGWQVRSGTSLDLVKWPDGAPGFCGKVTFHKYAGQGEQWPAIVLKTPGLRVQDWSLLQALRVSIYAEQPGTVQLFVSSSKDGKGSRYYHPIRLRAGMNMVKLTRQELNGIQFGQVTSLHYFRTRPQAEQVLYVGDLVGDFEDPQRAVAELLEGLSHARGVDTSQLPADKRLQVQKLLSQLDAIVSALPRDGQPVDGKAVQRGRRLLESLKALEQLVVFQTLNAHEGLSAGWVSGAEKVFRENQLFRPMARPRGIFHACGNEREGAQLVLYSSRNLTDVRVRAEVPSLPQVAVTVSPVCYVMCEVPTERYVPKRSGWMPDPICGYARTMTLVAGMYQPYFVEMRIPAGTPAGTYAGRVQVTAAGLTPLELPFDLRVFGFDLPSGAPYPLAVSRGATSLGKTFPRTSEARKTFADQCFQLLLDHRIGPDSIYRGTPPTVEEARRICQEPLGRFNILYVSTKKDARGRYPREAAEAVMAKLARAVPEYRKAGILQRAYIYVYDEAGPDMMSSMLDICRRIKGTYPDIPIMTTAYDETFGLATGLDAYVDIWVPLSTKMVACLPAAEAARQRGKKIWWYLCIDPRAPYANVLIDENDTIDGRLFMGMMAQKYRPDGFLYYCAALWRTYVRDSQGKWRSVSFRDRVMGGAPLTDWAGYSWKCSNGDGTWFYPGAAGPIPSLRLKNIQDGFEDYFYWELLRQAVSAVTSGRVSMSRDWRHEAAECLSAPDRLIRSMSDYSKDIAELESYRVRVGMLLEAYGREVRR